MRCACTKEKKKGIKRVDRVVSLSLFVSVQSSRLARQTPLECLSLHAPLYVSEGDPQSQRLSQGSEEDSKERREWKAGVYGCGRVNARRERRFMTRVTDLSVRGDGG